MRDEISLLFAFTALPPKLPPHGEKEERDQRVREQEFQQGQRVTSPLSGRACRRVLAGLVLLGEAAGFTDPVTGGGMTQALQSAELLAERLAADREWAETSLEAFDCQLESMLRAYRRLTEAVLWLGKHPVLIDASLATLRAVPSLFSHLLGISGGMRRFAGRRPYPVSCARRQKVHTALVAEET